MSLDQHPSNAALLRMKAEREARAGVPRVVRNAVELGPDSPLRPDGRRSPTPKRNGGNDELREHEIQVALFERIDDPAEQMRRPALAMAFAIPNGGKRSPRTAGRMKAEGVRPGVPDICCPVARGRYHGLWIELKRPGGATSPAQASWMHQLAREGYKVALHTTSEGAWAELCDYIDTS